MPRLVIEGNVIIFKVLKNTDGLWVQGKEKVLEVMVEYFKEIFNIMRPTGIERMVNQMDQCITN